MRISRRWLGVAGAMLGLLVAAVAPARAQVTVFAAASLTESLGDVAKLWAAKGHAAPVLSFASSSTIARQIESGAPANVFASADERWMDYLDQHKLLAPGTRRDLLGNRLVLIAPGEPGTTTAPALTTSFDMAGLLANGGKLAVGDPSHVPAGIYAQQALQRLGLWQAAAPALVPAEDVRAALIYVERGEVAAGIVYETDAAASRKVRVLAIFPQGSHEAIRYPFAVTRSGDTPEARAFLDFCAGPEAKAAFARRGFRPL